MFKSDVEVFLLLLGVDFILFLNVNWFVMFSSLVIFGGVCGGLWEFGI